jgi:hypothetical protein
MVEVLENMKPIKGTMLNAPMSHEMYETLMINLDKSEKECKEIADQYIERAKEEGPKMRDLYEEHPKVKIYLKVLKFFKKNNMIKDADVMFETFDGYVKKIAK